MRKVSVIEFLSVDGVMQGLGSPDEDTDGGFAHGGWGAPYAAAIHEAVATGPADPASAYLFGRRTYEKMAAFWPFQPDQSAMARQLNEAPKFVASRSLESPTWQGTTVLEGDLHTAVSGLKLTGAGHIAVLGSGVLVAQLMQLGLVDEFRLFIHPILLGTGNKLFRALPEPRRLHLADVTATSAGTVVVRYRVDQSMHRVAQSVPAQHEERS